MRTYFRRVLPFVAALAFVAVLGFEVRQALASCTLSVATAEPTTTDANSVGSFLETIGVSWSQSPGSGDWDVYYSYTPGNSEEIDTGDVVPEMETYIKNATLYTSGVEDIDCSGVLIDKCVSGVFQLSFYDGTSWECSGNHNFNVVSTATNCP